MSLTKEQIAEALKSDEAKDAIKAAIEEEVKGLKAKNAELLGSLKDEKDAKRKFEERLESLEADKLKAEELATMKTGDVEKIKEQLEARHKKELEKLTGDLSKTKGQLDMHVLGEGLTQALMRAKVSPALMDAAKALIRTTYNGEVGDNDGKPFAKFDGKSVDEFVTGWAQSDAGKHFVVADNNSGGSSNGANGTGKAGAGSAKTMTKAAFDQLSPADKSKVSIEGVKLTD